MQGKRLLRTIRLENILSYGPGGNEFLLEPLNVLIGPNASGKSNLIEALSLLSATPKDLQTTIRAGGGVNDWLWKGITPSPTATINATIEYPKSPMSLRHKLAFTETGSRFQLQDEAVENDKPAPGRGKPYFYYRYQQGNPAINVYASDDSQHTRGIQRENVKPDQFILSQRRDPESYPELTWLANQFESMKFYREWNFGTQAPPRLLQRPDMPNDNLMGDASNLGVLLSNLLNQPPVKRHILELMRTFYQAVDDIVVTISGGMPQIFLHETELQHPIPAARLSDGSLRYLCLLAVLCHPDPPPIICIEEPETGLHPDIIPEMAKLLIEASSRSQIFITTHSDILVDALTDTPEAIVVCEKHNGATQLRRLDATEIKSWLEQYRSELDQLGSMWISGEIGGNRW